MFTASFKVPHLISWKARKVHGEIKMSEDLAAVKLSLTVKEAVALGLCKAQQPWIVPLHMKI